jgi:hypothetical protein
MQEMPSKNGVLVSQGLLVGAGALVLRRLAAVGLVDLPTTGGIYS